MALTIETATGIKQFVEEKGFSKWFDALFPLVKSRDSWQAEQAIEPSASSGPSTPSTPVVELLDVDDDPGEDEGASKAMFVPSRKRRRKDAESSSSDKVLKLLGETIKNNPTKELLQFMKEDAEKSRQHELQLLQCLAGQSHGVFANQSHGVFAQKTMHETMLRIFYCHLLLSSFFICYMHTQFFTRYHMSNCVAI